MKNRVMFKLPSHGGKRGKEGGERKKNEGEISAGRGGESTRNRNT